MNDTINYETLKEAAHRAGRSVNTLIALAPQNDPFYVGRPSEKTGARWFGTIWRRFGYCNGVHLRRIHYRLISQDPPVALPDGLLYENTEQCWDYLNNASKWARYLGAVPAESFADRRNSEARIYAPALLAGSDQPRVTPRFSLVHYPAGDFDSFAIPELPQLPSLPDALPELPGFAIEGYVDRHPIMGEVWVEKTAMNDILDPLCRQHGWNLITGAGELSITTVLHLIDRIRQGGNQPTRILYISDFDPAGLGTPVSVARKIEYYARQSQVRLDIRLEPVLLTREQVWHYGLPRTPVKSSEQRRAGFKTTHREGAVELDALEALHPGELAQVVQGAMQRYHDPRFGDRAGEMHQRLAHVLAGVRHQITGQYTSEIEMLQEEYTELLNTFAETQAQFAALVAPFQARLDIHRARMDALRERGQALYQQILDALAAQDVVDITNYPLPEAELPDGPGNLLYDSRREYFEQLAYYQAHRNGRNGRRRA